MQFTESLLTIITWFYKLKVHIHVAILRPGQIQVQQGEGRAGADVTILVLWQLHLVAGATNKVLRGGVGAIVHLQVRLCAVCVGESQVVHADVGYLCGQMENSAQFYLFTNNRLVFLDLQVFHSE